MKKIGVVTDKTIARLPPLSAALESLTLAGVDFEVFESVSIEPDNDRYVYMNEVMCVSVCVCIIACNGIAV